MFFEPMVFISESPPPLSTGNAYEQHFVTCRFRAVTCTEAARARVVPRGKLGRAGEGCEEGIWGARGRQEQMGSGGWETARSVGERGKRGGRA